VSEHGFQGKTHWLMFLFEVKKKIDYEPMPHREGKFKFFTRSELAKLKLPQTDQEKIWPWFWKYRGGFFAAHCQVYSGGQNEWTLEESWNPNNA
jgi:8-oxo-dGTP diphosphatase